jgi:hypothetical protein
LRASDWINIVLYFEKEFCNMNQNVVGVIFFSLIVGTAIFAGGLFYPESNELGAVEKIPLVGKEDHYVAPSTVRVVQATFNVKTQTLSAVIKHDDRNEFIANVLLHVFVTDNNSNRFLATHVFRPIIVSTGGNVYTNSHNFKAISNLKSFENLFVIAESANNFGEDSPPAFDAETAVPVLIEKGKN